MECLQEICKQLHQTHPSSVLSFALVSKQFYSAGAAFLFRVRTINIQSRRLLVEDIARIRPEIRKYIRCLIVQGNMPCRQDDTSQPIHILGFTPVPRFSTDDRSRSEIVYDEDEAWVPLADLISSLTVLSDLMYDCPNQFPPCLLRALHEYHAGCRLHLKKFQLFSLNNPQPDPHEVALGTSPCLYSLDACYSLIRPNITKNYMHDVVLELVSGLAPNLSKVSIRWVRTKASALVPTPLPNACRSLKPRQHGTSQIRSSDIGSLEELHIDIRIHADIPSWTVATDFSVLRVLKIQRDAIDIQTLGYLANHCNLVSLKELSFKTLHLRPYRSQTPVDDGVCHLLRSLPPLSHFSLDGHITREIFDAIISHHGHALQELQMNITAHHIQNIVLRQQDILAISEKCQKLESLAISIPRSTGDADEVAIYRSLGFIKQLKHLTLKLDASRLDVAWVYDPADEDAKYDRGGYDGETESDISFDDFQASFYPWKTYGDGRKLRNGHLTNALIQSALDEKLACSIFKVISSSKSAGSIPLESLEISSVGGHAFSYNSTIRGDVHSGPGLMAVLTAVSRMFRIERDPRDNRQDELVVMDISSHVGQTILSQSNKLQPSAEPIFRRVWPGSGQEDSKWAEDWSSFPLHEVQ
jgi:hypothetical protein